MEEIYAKLQEQWTVFTTRHEKYVETSKTGKGNKTAEADARIALGEIKKLVTDYRKASVEVTSKK